ncbi:hypothetical protein [Rhizohabitans arisaemae]|uniref:hypothetical protein n=1 Tax=Rhizohabitans arisaemae TaxID=2720610 RepID=UPI0024B1BDA2|nr:hypothetical protein [Rhizohabitans arisaemae]
MSGYYEVRLDGPKPGGGKGRHHYRLYCLLDDEAKDVDQPLLTVITGFDKPYRTTLRAADYKSIQDLGAEYLSRNPRVIS